MFPRNGGDLVTPENSLSSPDNFKSKPGPKLTLGPILFHWDADTKHDFYARIADEAEVDTVYLGEVVCSKRTPFFDVHLPDVIERLQRAGKKVVMSTLAEVVLPRERAMTVELCSQTEMTVEVNNAAGLIRVAGRAHRVGPMMNVYNEETMRFLNARGADHFTLPAELPGRSVAAMGQCADALGVGLEMQVFGRAPLALSARCFHARAHRRSKDECRFVCQDDPDGMDLSTIANVRTLAINGIQTLSYGYLNYLAEIDAIIAAGVSHFRLMPHTIDMVALIKIFADRLASRTESEEALQRAAALGAEPFVNGFWHALAGYRYVVPAVAET